METVVSMKDVLLAWISKNKRYATNNLKMHKDIFDILFYLLLEEFIDRTSDEVLEELIDNVCTKYQKNVICESTIEQFKQIIMNNKKIFTEEDN